MNIMLHLVYLRTSTQQLKKGLKPICHSSLQPKIQVGDLHVGKSFSILAGDIITSDANDIQIT